MADHHEQRDARRIRRRRLASDGPEHVIEGPSARERQRPSVDSPPPGTNHPTTEPNRVLTMRPNSGPIAMAMTAHNYAISRASNSLQPALGEAKDPSDGFSYPHDTRPSMAGSSSLSTSRERYLGCLAR